jgi:pyruvate kinase
MHKKTKILVTVGPSSDSIETIEKLIKAGANIFRLNFSHGTYEYHTKVLKNIKKASKNLNKIVGILQDISGPKVRLGELKSDFNLKQGDKITFIEDEIVGYKENKNNYVMSINYPKLLSKVKIDEYIYLYDGLIRAKIIQAKSKIIALVENDGLISSRKGINFPNTKINIDIITQKDKQDITWGIENKIDYFAISFVQNKHDILNAKKLLKNNTAKLIAKIEKFDAVENIDEILEVSDGIMVARGDLGIEVPYFSVPTIQKELIKKANLVSKPVITATQMLLSMTKNQRATRAEISDVANAVLDGTDVVMLSEESAIGKYPVESVETMNNIISKAEEMYNYVKQYNMDYLDMNDVVQATATKLADDINAKGILALTASGQSATRMSRYRPKTPIFAFTHKKKILNSLTMNWGVIPVGTIEKSQTTQMIGEALKQLKSNNILDINGSYVVTIGYPSGISGNTNTIKILNKEDIKYYLNHKK